MNWNLVRQKSWKADQMSMLSPKGHYTDKSKILPSHLPHGALVSVGDVVRTADGFQLIGTSEVVEINITEVFIGNKLRILFSFNHFTYVMLFKPANLAND
jgi:hypothetical protein